ncbi:MAG TPA: hypothetical protein VGL58_03470 [Caulobacteraceae bacterium]
MSDQAASARPLFTPRTAIALVLVGVFGFSAFVTLLAYAPDLQQDPFCRANVYSSCAVGFAGLEELIREDGAPTVINRTPLPKGREQGLLIVTPEARTGGDAKNVEVIKLGFGGPMLVVLPKWATTPDALRLSWGDKSGLLPVAEMPLTGDLAGLTVARRGGVARPALSGAYGLPLEKQALTPGPIDSLQTVHGDGWTPVLTDETGAAVIVQASGHAIYVLADPDLLNTQGLANLDTLTAGAAIVRSLRAGDGPFIFDVTLNGYARDPSALKLMFDPPFLAVTLCIAAALALAGWQAMLRFGPTARAGRAIALGKQGLTDNSAQLIRLARREPAMAPRYAALTRDAAARAVGAPKDLGGEALDQFLNRIGARAGAGESFTALSAEAGHVRDRAGLAAVAQKLYRWRLEMTRERK